MIFCETLIIAVTELVAGIIFGIVFSKLIFLILIKLLRFSTPLKFMLDTRAMVVSSVLFGIIFLTIAIHNMWQVGHVSTVELLHGQHHGEKEPKTKILMTLIGIITLGAGYTIAVTVKKPLEALMYFFIAVVLVVIGTYALFTAGSIALLKVMRKNKRYYYKTNHFISVSGMIYRMKQNAVGLANICILSTMVLVMVSTTVSLYAGMENVLMTRFPNEFEAILYDSDSADLEKLVEAAHEEADKVKGAEIKDEIVMRDVSFCAVVDGKNRLEISDNVDYSSGIIVSAFTLQDYNRMAKTDISLGEGEVLIYMNEQCESMDLGEGTLKLGDLEYSIKERVKDLNETGKQTMNALDTVYVVMEDEEELVNLSDTVEKIQGNAGIDGDISLNFKGKKEAVAKLTSNIKQRFEDSGLHVYIEVREASRASFYSFYGGFLFLGIFFGSLSLMATVLIIYYKQISEGYDDKERFQIMQKVGMSKREVKKAIHSQVIAVFALPLIAAVIHICVAFKVIVKLLAIMNLTDVGLFRNCMFITVGVFGIIYVIVYSLTAREYYRIVN